MREKDPSLPVGCSFSVRNMIKTLRLFNKEMCEKGKLIGEQRNNHALTNSKVDKARYII